MSTLVRERLALEAQEKVVKAQQEAQAAAEAVEAEERKEADAARAASHKAQQARWRQFRDDDAIRQVWCTFLAGVTADQSPRNHRGRQPGGQRRRRTDGGVPPALRVAPSPAGSSHPWPAG